MELSRGLEARSIAALAAALLFASFSADAAGRQHTVLPQCPTSGADVVSVTRALDGADFLAADGREVKLAGVIAPGKDGEVATSVQAQTAKKALNDLLKSATVTLTKAGTNDRYGRTVAQVFAGDVWVQGELLRRGLVRAAPDSASASCTRMLLAAEAVARAARAGAWASGAFRILRASGAKARTGTFQIVEGNVTSSAVNRGRAYVNFGDDYRDDFTVTVPEGNLRAFRQADIDLRRLAGKRLRVRGWMDFYNGPEMEISSPSAIEMVGESIPASPKRQSAEAGALQRPSRDAEGEVR